jgi:hypothetical protein
MKKLHSTPELKSPSYWMIIIFTLFIFTSCNSSKDTGGITSNEVTIIKGNQTIIVSGANGIKGKKISLSVLVKEGVILDSIQYESFYQPINIIESKNDTLFVDAHFYPIRSAKNLTSSSNPIANSFTSNDCTVYYHTGKKAKTIIVRDLKVITNNTKWE